MKKIILIGFALLAISARLPAQGGGGGATGNLTAQSTNCATTNSCLILNVEEGLGSATFKISGTMNVVIQFEASADPLTTPSGNASWVAFSVGASDGSGAVTSATESGSALSAVWQGNVGAYRRVRMRVSTYTSGTVAAGINLSTASARGGGGSGGGGSVLSCTTAGGVAYENGTANTLTCSGQNTFIPSGTGNGLYVNTDPTAGVGDGAVNGVSTGTATGNLPGNEGYGVTGTINLTVNTPNTVSSTVAGVGGEAIGEGTGTIAELIGNNADVKYLGSGTATNAYDYVAGADMNTGGGTITNHFGYYSSDLAHLGTNNYAFYSNTQTACSTCWAFYSNGTAPSYLQGNILTGNSAALGSDGITGILISGSTTQSALDQVGVSLTSIWAPNATSPTSPYHVGYDTLISCSLGASNTVTSTTIAGCAGFSGNMYITGHPNSTPANTSVTVTALDNFVANPPVIAQLGGNAGTLLSTATSGFRSLNQGNGNTTNSYAFRAEAQSGSAGSNYGFYSDGGLNQLNTGLLSASTITSFSNSAGTTTMTCSTGPINCGLKNTNSFALGQGTPTACQTNGTSSVVLSGSTTVTFASAACTGSGPYTNQIGYSFPAVFAFNNQIASATNNPDNITLEYDNSIHMNVWTSVNVRESQVALDTTGLAMLEDHVGNNSIGIDANHIACIGELATDWNSTCAGLGLDNSGGAGKGIPRYFRGLNLGTGGNGFHFSVYSNPLAGNTPGGHTGNVGATTIYTCPASGYGSSSSFTLDLYAVATSSVATSTIQLKALWTDAQQAQTDTQPAVAASFATAGAYTRNKFFVVCSPSNVIQIQTVTANSPVYDLYITLSLE